MPCSSLLCQPLHSLFTQIASCSLAAACFCFSSSEHLITLCLTCCILSIFFSALHPSASSVRLCNSSIYSALTILVLLVSLSNSSVSSAQLSISLSLLLLNFVSFLLFCTSTLSSCSVSSALLTPDTASVYRYLSLFSKSFSFGSAVHLPPATK